MKTLSIKQPWAELILQGKKTIELRSWNTKFRGEFFIHASLAPDKRIMQHFGFSDLPCGAIVGKAVLIDVKKYENKEDFSLDQNKHQATSDFGEYGFILENVSRLETPIIAKGKLGFWNFNDNSKI